MTTDELKSYYANLLIYQYLQKPKANATIKTLSGEAVADIIFMNVRDAFNIETAVGKQLDFLGQLIGVTRYFHGIAAKSYFGMPNNGDTYNNFHGFAPSANPDTGWYWLRDKDITAPLGTLTDGDFRRLIKYVAKLRVMDISLKAIDELLNEFFGNTIIATEGTMEITYTVGSNTDQVISAIRVMGYLPKPSGVAIIIV